MATKSNGALEERLNGLETMSRDSFARIEALVTQIDQRLRALESTALADVAVQKSRLDAAWKKIDEDSILLVEQDKFLERLKPIYSAIIWLWMTLGVLVVGLLWAIFTHRVELK